MHEKKQVVGMIKVIHNKHHRWCEKTKDVVFFSMNQHAAAVLGSTVILNVTVN